MAHSWEADYWELLEKHDDLQAALRYVVEVLEEIEWVPENCEVSGLPPNAFCPFCGCPKGYDNAGHHENCKVALALDRAKEVLDA